MDVDVIEDFNGFQLAAYVSVMTRDLQTKAEKKIVSEQAKRLAKEVRRQIQAADMPWSRGRTRELRRVARERGIKPLIRTIAIKTFNIKDKGIVGKIVGARWPEGAHSHLVERGFRHPKSGRTTKAHRYQEKAMKAVEREMQNISVEALRKWIRELDKKGRSTARKAGGRWRRSGTAHITAPFSYAGVLPGRGE